VESHSCAINAQEWGTRTRRWSLVEVVCGAEGLGFRPVLVNQAQKAELGVRIVS
jgi:hypothetical protein